MNSKANEQFVTCPNCQEKIPLTQALTSHIETDLKKQLQEEYDNKIKLREKKVKEDTEKVIAEKYETDLQDLKNQVSEKDKKLKEMNKRELDLNKRERELLEKEEEMQLKVTEQVRSQVSNIEKKIKEDTEKVVTERYEMNMKDLNDRLLEREQKISVYNKQQQEFARKEKELSVKEESIENMIAEQVSKQVDEAKKKAIEDATKENSIAMSDMQSQIKELQEKLSSAHEEELKLRKKQRDLEADKKEWDLNKERELDAAKDEIFHKAKSESDADFKLKLRDKDLKLEQLTKTVEQLNKKLEQGSQQLQGESQELELEDTLKHHFPSDEIIPIAKGVKGADIIQKVKNQYGYECGIILWESKRHKRYDPKWIEKLKDDQRNEKANVAVLITQVLPENISTFGLECGVYVGSFNSAVGIALALRDQLFKIQMLRQSDVGKNQKMESLYNYLTSHEFSQRIAAILEAFESMQKQIADERKAFEKQWSLRSKLLSQVIKSTAGMHGDLKGLIGASLPDVDGLLLPGAIEEDVADLSNDKADAIDDDCEADVVDNNLDAPVDDVVSIDDEDKFPF
jgi:hypothetical protein